MPEMGRAGGIPWEWVTDNGSGPNNGWNSNAGMRRQRSPPTCPAVGILLSQRGQIGAPGATWECRPVSWLYGPYNQLTAQPIDWEAIHLIDKEYSTLFFHHPPPIGPAEKNNIPFVGQSNLYSVSIKFKFWLQLLLKKCSNRSFVWL